MESILLVVHVIVALAIVGLIMLQQGKGAEMGASFGGGGSQTVFGAAGSGNFFSRMTAILVAVFFITSFVLAIMAQRSVGVNDSIIPLFDEPVEQSTIPDAEPVNPVPTGQVPAAGQEGNVIPEVDNGDATGNTMDSEQAIPESE